MTDVPFAVPAGIVLDLPPPPSVNRTRKINWAAQPKMLAWTRRADALTTAAWSGGKRPKVALDKFEAVIVMSEKASRIDLDNGIKKVLDYARRLGLIVDDGPRYMRRIVIQFGDAPEGCRLILRPSE